MAGNRYAPLSGDITQAMAEQIEQAKARRREASSPLSALDDVLAAVQSLREHDTARYQREVAKIRQALDLDGPTEADRLTALRGR